MSAVADAHKSTMALASFATSLDAATLPAEVRQKLGWLLLDHLRVCSIGARLSWSDWSRRYVGLVGKAGASHVLSSVPGGPSYAIARNQLNIGTPTAPEYSEFTGPTFSDDGRTLFVNIQTPGITLAITGPWATYLS